MNRNQYPIENHQSWTIPDLDEVISPRIAWKNDARKMYECII